MDANTLLRLPLQYFAQEAEQEQPAEDPAELLQEAEQPPAAEQEEDPSPMAEEDPSPVPEQAQPEQPIQQGYELESIRAALAAEQAARAALERKAQQAQQALGLFFGGTELDELIDQANAAHTGKTPQEAAQLRQQEDFTFQTLQAQERELDGYKQKEVQRMMQEDLSKIRKLDPNVKTLQELGEPFFRLIGAGVDAVTAYSAISTTKPRPKPASSGKEHLVPTGGTGSAGDTLPAELAAEYRRYGISEKDAAEDYKKMRRKGA